ncbi:hypothetical protein JAAARDRAFT_504651 [Jaapia argillacea MUCL 33604]|uniref:Uncharacterized protein n=1 Tax=Jaapia argillacea MUCL 33604 TaxID=933084 RepID=A0A067PMK7_9AGAM|nr:hypothetical protein JAAARDRAFT_504651 [Jaapia argillacea MUCL 33604]
MSSRLRPRSAFILAVYTKALSRWQALPVSSYHNTPRARLLTTQYTLSDPLRQRWGSRYGLATLSARGHSDPTVCRLQGRIRPTVIRVCLLSRWLARGGGRLGRRNQ